MTGATDRRKVLRGQVRKGIKVQPVYHPLYLNNGRKMIVLVTGGRGSGKSFNVETFLERLTFEAVPSPRDEAKLLAHQILCARYTMVSADISVIPEFLEKIEMEGTQKYFRATKKDVINRQTGSHIMFRGIKTSSGNQTAKLKSIHGLTVFVCDEAEEWTSFDDFEKIMLSIRTLGIQNLIIIVMNPTDSGHFIYQKYIKDTHRIEYFDGVPVQISTHPDVLHIHTTYLDNIENLSPQFLENVETMKRTDPERYAHIVMGQWADVAEGAVFKKWGICKEFPTQCKHVALGIDFGYTCFVGETLVTTKRGEIPIKDVVEGDYVLTRRGYHRVRRNLYNGRKRVIEKTIITDAGDIKVASTYTHNINANGKWKKYGELTKGDKLFVLSPSTGESSGDTQTGSIQTTTITSGKKKDVTTKYSCIMRCMSSIMEQSPKVKSFITRISTRLTMKLKTLWQLLLQNTCRFISLLKNGCTNTLMKSENMASQKTTGIVGEIKSWISWLLKREDVNGAEMSSRQQTHIKDSVQSDVITDGSTNRQATTSNLHASSAENSSWETNTFDKGHAATNAHIISCGVKDVITENEYEADVYDLEIEGVNEYFANGMLAHNCDPTAIVMCGLWDNRLYIKQLCYKTGMLSKDIIKFLQPYSGLMVFADSADPRLIDEIALGGIMIYPVAKPAGSIVAGIDKMQSYDDIFVTEDSIELQEEMRNYVWDKDKDGNYINQPIDAWNHAIDAARYYTLGKLLGKIVKNLKVTKKNSKIAIK